MVSQFSFFFAPPLARAEGISVTCMYSGADKLPIVLARVSRKPSHEMDTVPEMLTEGERGMRQGRNKDK